MKLLSLSAALFLMTLASPVFAGQRAAAPAPPARPQPPATLRDVKTPPIQVVPMQDGRGPRETRDWFKKVLEQYPPSVREVLQIDTSLLSRPDYLATYPALAHSRSRTR